LNDLPGGKQIRIGFLAGDFPWTAPPPQVGKLLSGGVMARNITRALSQFATVVPFTPPPDVSPDAPRGCLETFLRSIDLLWADVYPGRTEQALALRQKLPLPLPVLLNAQGAAPKALEAMLFPWRSYLLPGDGMLFTCEADRTIWRNLVSQSALREWVAPLPIDETTFYPRHEEARTAARERLDVPASAPLLLYVGRLNIQKNLHSLLRLLAAVREQVPDVGLCCIGAEDDIVFGELRVTNTGYVASLHALAAELGLTAAVRFCGLKFGEELAQAYCAADVLVNASFYHRENFGLSQAEAQACGTPVVCSHWGGFKAMIDCGATGYMMETVLSKHGVWVDWAAGARSVCTLLQNPDLQERMRVRSAIWAQERFSISAVAQHLKEIVTTMLQPPTPLGHSVEPPGGSPGIDLMESEAAYEPSAFAATYEAHKRACGWYVGQSRDDPPSRYSRMFEGVDYALYEQMMRPYATRLAEEVTVEMVDADWIPYFPSGIQLDVVRHSARVVDPIWTLEQSLTARAWAVLCCVDGRLNVGQMAERLIAAGAVQQRTQVIIELWRLHIEGFVLFST
jgi:glycosyltransferase involved in cell wall biosynthesis